MWGEIAQLLIALPIAVGLVFAVPRQSARAWAMWLLVCIMYAAVQGIGQGIVSYYVPEQVVLWTKEHQLELAKDETGNVAAVVVNKPPRQGWATRLREQRGGVAGAILILAVAVLVLLLRAEREDLSAETGAKSSGRGIGISLQAFGLVVVVGVMAEALTTGNETANVIGVAVIASGYYVSRGSRLAAKWAVLFMALFAVVCLLLVLFIAVRENVTVLGRQIGPSEAPWAITIGLLVTAWAAADFVLTLRFLQRTSGPAHDLSAGNGQANQD